MKRRLLILPLVALALPVAAQTPMGTIGGQVVAAATGRPIAGARVLLSQADAGRTAMTDADGRFEFRSMFRGQYRLVASAAGYLNGAYNAEPLIGHTPVAVAPGGAITDLVIKLHRGGTIAGRIVDSKDEPVVAGTVRAFRTSGGGSKTLLLPASRSMGLSFSTDPTTKTDDRGEYRIIGVEPGEYAIGLVDGPTVTYAPASPTTAGATIVLMGVDEERAGMNIRVERAPSEPVPSAPSPVIGVRVSGRLQPVFPNTTRVRLIPIVRETNARFTEARVAADGAFSFAAVAPGRYEWWRIQGLVAGAGPRSLLSIFVNGRDVSDLPFDVGGDAIDDVRLTLSEASMITGTLRDSAGAITTAGAIVILPVDAAQSSEASRRVRVVRADTTGYFEARQLPPGRYRIAHVTRLSTGHVWEPAFAATLSGAREVVVPEAQTVTVDLRVK